MEPAEELLLEILGGDPRLAPLTQRLIKRTEGNPFFLEESVRTLVESHALSGERGAYRLAKPIEPMQVPASVQAVLAARIDRLPTESKKLLESAAVIGHEVPFAILREIAGLPEELLRLGLAELQAGEFLQETKRFPDLEYAFKHALTHEVAYSSILRSRRRQLHAGIMGIMERLYSDLGPHIERLGYHAFVGEAWDQAVRYLSQAAARALARCAYRNATVHCEQALVALRHLPQTSLTLEQAIDLRFDLRNSLHPVGDLKRALGYLREAEGLAQTLNDQQRLGWLSVYTSGHLWQIGDTIQALASAERAKAIAEQLSEFPLQVAANFYVGQACFVLGQYRRAETAFRDNMSMLRNDLGRQLLGLAGLPSVLSGSYLAWTLAEQGDFVKGLSHGQEAVRVAEATDHRYSLVLASWRLACLYDVRGETQSATVLLERAMGLCRDSDLTLLEPYVTSSLGSAYARAGRISDGLSLLYRAVDAFEAVGLGAFYSLTIVRLAEACNLAGERDEAMTYIRRAVSLTRERGERGSEAYAVRLLADIALRPGPPDVEMVESPYRQAIGLAEQLGMRPLIAHCHLGLGKLYRRTGKQDEAREHLTTATGMYREMDMRFWIEQSEMEMKDLE
jgi:tetratricopeptide (TPR) repeat protein